MSQGTNINASFAQRLLWRDWKSGHLNLLILSLILAVATVTSISLFTSRIKNSIYDEASTFIAGDAKITGTIAPEETWRAEAERRGIQHADIIVFRAMAFAGENMLLCAVKAVSEQYPLKGDLSISDIPYQPSRKVKTGPAPGEAWLAPRVMNALDVKKGDLISVGDADFRVAASLNKEPDSGQNFFGVAPRILIHIDDIEKTNAVQVGSRIGHGWVLAADKNTIASFKEWVEPQIGKHRFWRSVEDENQGVGSALDRAQSFLLLTACLSVVLTGVAIVLSARRYAKQQQSQVAILKTFGLKPADINRLYIINIFTIGVISILLGGFLGWLFHWGIIISLGSLMPADLASPSWLAYTTGSVTGFIALWAFAAPPIFDLRQVAPASILREDNDPVLKTGWSSALGVFAILLLMLFYSQSITLTAIVFSGLSLCFAGVAALSSVLIKLVKKLSVRLSYTWRLGLANLQRHQRFNILQMIAFSILFMLLFILLSIRINLISQWQEQLPENSPNHFLFNIFSEDIPGIKAYLQENNVDASPFYPMTRGRIVSANSVPLEDLLPEKRNEVNYEREFNLTWAQDLGSDNKVVDGLWWDKVKNKDKLQISVEKSFAEGIDLHIGDTMTFSIAGQDIVAEIASIRSVQWDSMNPNFYVIFNQSFFAGGGANWITSFYLPTTQKALLNQLTRKFPTLSVIEFDQTIKQVQSIISKVSLAIEFIFILVLGSGFLVLISSIQSTLDIRLKESAIFRTLGANRSLVRKTLLIEFCTLGGIAGVLAIVGTELCMYFLQTRVFNFEQHQGQYYLWLLGPVCCATLIGVTGWLSSKKVVNIPPLNVLRDI